VTAAPIPINGSFVVHNKSSDQALDVAILPRVLWCDPYVLNAHPFNSRSEVLAVDSVAISNHVLWCAVVRKRLDNLLCSPDRGRMLSNIEVEDASTIMCEDNKNVQHAQLNGWHRKEIDRYQLTDMISQECHPTL